jgi:hypothetical protein
MVCPGLKPDVCVSPRKPFNIGIKLRACALTTVSDSKAHVWSRANAGPAAIGDDCRINGDLMGSLVRRFFA